MKVEFLASLGEEKAPGPARKDQIGVGRGVTLVRDYRVGEETTLLRGSQNGIQLGGS